MLTETFVVPWAYASSARGTKAALVPELAPTGMVMLWPLLSWITSGEPVTALFTLAV